MVSVIDFTNTTGFGDAAGRLWPTSGLSWAIATVGTVGACVVTYRHRDSLVEGLLLAALSLVATALAVVDLQEHRLPNRIVGPLALVTVGAVLLSGWSSDDMARPVAAIALGVGFSGLMLLGYWAGGFRLGDVKYAFPIGVAVGWQGTPAFFAMLLALTVTGLLVGLLALGKLRSLHTRVPYGPVMTIALLGGLLV